MAEATIERVETEDNDAEKWEKPKSAHEHPRVMVTSKLMSNEDLQQ